MHTKKLIFVLSLLLLSQLSFGQQLRLYGWVTHAACYEGDGAIELTVDGGTAPFTYFLNEEEIGKSESRSFRIYGLKPYTYEAKVVDHSGASASEIYAVLAPPPVQVEVSLSPASCGLNNGAAAILISGGGSTYKGRLFRLPNNTTEYRSFWSEEYTTTTISDLPAGSYLLHVYDAQGCESYTSFIIPQQVNTLELSANITASLCGQNNGAIDLQVSGGQMPFRYSWSNGAVTRNLSGLSPDTYTVTVTDAADCSVTASYNLSEPPSLSVALSVIPNTVCTQNFNGAVHVNISGGAGPYAFSWTRDGSTLPHSSPNLTNIPGGRYALTVTDMNHCVVIAEAVVPDQPYLPVLSLTKGDVSCAGSATGWISVNTQPGIHYSYSAGAYYNPATALPVNGIITHLSAGQYTVRAYHEVIGCESTASIAIADRTPLEVGFSIEASGSCAPAAANGAISMQVSGGQSPYTFRWQDGATTANRSGLSPGTYWVTVIDAAGCAKEMITLLVPHQPVVPSLSLSSLPTTACDPAAANGMIMADISAIDSYSYTLYRYEQNSPKSISSGSAQTSQVQAFSGMSTGNYLLEVVAGNGCSVEAAISVGEVPAVPVITAVSVIPNASCDGAAANGSASVTTISLDGTAANPSDFSFQWTDAAGALVGTGMRVSQLPAGNYQLIATKLAAPGMGCASPPYTVVVPHEPIYAAIALSSTSDQTCQATPSGAINATISSPTAAFNWRWTKTDDPSFSRTGTEASPASLSGLAAGEYLLSVITAMGCEIEASAVVAHEPLYPTIDFAKGDVACHGESNGWVSLEAQADMEYSLWRNETLVQAAFTGRLEGLQPGEYQLKAVHTLTSCETTASLTIAEPALLQLNATVQQLSATEAADGNITLSVSGGIPPYTFLWSNGTTSSDLDGLMPGNYSVRVTDANNCSQETSVVIDPVAPLGLADGERAGILRVSRTGSGHLRVELTEGINARELTLYRLDGSLCAHTDMLGKNVAEISLPIAEPRFYLLVLTTKEKVYRKKIVF